MRPRKAPRRARATARAGQGTTIWTPAIRTPAMRTSTTGKMGARTMAADRVGVYPGTSDPVTNGHLDIIRRATRLVDRLIIGVARNAGKGPLFGIDERVQMLREEVAVLETANGGQIEIRPFDNLLMHFAQASGAVMIIRGLRAVSDFEYE